MAFASTPCSLSRCYADSKVFDMTRNVAVEHEPAFVKAFIVRAKQERYLELLSKPKRRQAVLDSLAHFSDLDPRFQVPIPPSERSPSGIEALLRSRGAPSECYLISEDGGIGRPHRCAIGVPDPGRWQGHGDIAVVHSRASGVLRRRGPRGEMAS